MRLTLALGLLLIASSVAAQPRLTARQECGIYRDPDQASPAVARLTKDTRVSIPDADVHQGFYLIATTRDSGFVPRVCFDAPMISRQPTGHSVDSLLVYGGFVNRLAQKDEFETTAQRDERVDRWLRALRVHGRSIDSTFTLVSRLSSGDATYNADAGYFSVTLPNTYTSFSHEESIGTPPQSSTGTYLTLYERTRPGRSYTTETTYGRPIRVRVKTEVRERHLLAVPRSQSIDRPLRVFVPRSEARAVSANLAAVFTVRLVPPYVYAGTGIAEQATLDDPNQVDEIIKLLYAEVVSLSIVDVSNGRVYIEMPIVDPRTREALSTRSVSPSPGETPPPDFLPVEKQAVPIYRVEPEYPEIACQAGIEGRVTVRVWVGRDGSVKDVNVLRSDNEIFDESVLAAVRLWRFDPAMQAGRPVDVWTTLPIRFRQSHSGSEGPQCASSGGG